MRNFLVENGFDVKKGQSGAFKRWLDDNEEKLTAACPDGVEYVGTFANIFSSEKETGGYRTLFTMDAYSGMDALSAAMKIDGEFANLMEALAQFQLDGSDGGDWSTVLSRRVTDSALWGDHDE